MESLQGSEQAISRDFIGFPVISLVISECICPYNSDSCIVWQTGSMDDFSLKIRVSQRRFIRKLFQENSMDLETHRNSRKEKNTNADE